MRNAVALCLRTARRVDNSAITYRRGSARVAGIIAAMGDSEYEVENADGLIAEIHTADFLISVADLSRFGRPQENDEIDAVMIDGTTATFIVTAPSPEPAWRFSDNYRSTYRVHTKRVNG